MDRTTQKFLLPVVQQVDSLLSRQQLLTNEPKYQPGFENMDTMVSGAIALYGYFGWFNENVLQELKYLKKEIPPIFIAHGDKDSIARISDARYLAQQLRNISDNPIVYAELPGAQHNFDLFHSIRTEAVIDSIEIFSAWTLEKQRS